jgi:hypothetical protein
MSSGHVRTSTTVFLVTTDLTPYHAFQKVASTVCAWKGPPKQIPLQLMIDNSPSWEAIGLGGHVIRAAAASVILDLGPDFCAFSS